MTLDHLKHLVLRIHETTKEHAPTKRKHVAVMLGRIVVGIAVLKDKRLGVILRGMLSRSH